MVTYREYKGGTLGTRNPPATFIGDSMATKVPARFTRHKLSEIFGDMPRAQFKELVADVAENGLQNDILVAGNEIVDGWHRYRALQELRRGIPEERLWQYEESRDGPLPALVMSLNAHRRHMSPASRKAVADELVRAGATAKYAAESVGMHPKSYSRAKRTEREKATGPTLESLQKKEAKLEGQLEAVRAQIAELQTISKSLPARAVRRVR